MRARVILLAVALSLTFACASGESSNRRMTGANPPPAPSPGVRAIDVGPTRGIYHLKGGLSPEEAEKLGVKPQEEEEADERRQPEEVGGSGARP